MKKLLYSFLFSLISIVAISQNSPVGLWKTIDDKTGEATSHVKIYEEDGIYYGKVVKLLQDDPGTICEVCPGDKKGKPVVGMIIMWGLKKHKNYWSYGRIMDPENGKTYKCNVRLQNDGTLKLRGYIGFAALGRNQIWHRV